jgi:Lhr-like helicase
MRSIRATVLFTILLWILWVSLAAAEGLVTLNVDIPPGKWKAARLRNLPKDAVVAVQVVSNGEITVALVNSKDYRRFSETSRPLFAGRLEKRLAFSVSISAKGDYFLVLDNRSGREPRSVRVTVRAARAGAGQAKSAEEILKSFEQQLHQIFVFKPFPIGIKQCGAPQAFVGTSGIFLCAEYVHHLYDILKDKERTKNTLSFSIFHEVARLLLSQWNHPSSSNTEVADEFATVLMIMLNQKERLIAAATYFIKHPSVSETFSKLFMDDRHPLSVPRAQNVLKWARDAQTARQWQKDLVPRMQTSLLKRLKQQPTPWTDLPLVEKELVKRRGGSRTEF